VIRLLFPVFVRLMIAIWAAPSFSMKYFGPPLPAFLCFFSSISFRREAIFFLV